MKKRVLVLGIGGTGAKVAQTAFCVGGDDILPIVLDTDAVSLNKITVPNKMDLATNETLGSVTEKLNATQLSWLSFYGQAEGRRVSYAEEARMDIGSGGWRAKAMVAFVAFCNNDENKAKLDAAIDALFEGSQPEQPIEIYAAASLAGGTGSALLLPVTLYVKKYIREKYGMRPLTAALLMCPEVYAASLSGERRLIARANAYATMRELGAVNQTAWRTEENEGKRTELKFAIGNTRDHALGLLFDSTDPAFATPEALPFDRVYLYEKNPGADDIGVQAELFARVLTSLCRSDILASSCEDDPTSDKQAIYTAVSAGKLRVDAPNVAVYLADRILLEALGENFGYVARSAEAQVKAKHAAIKQYGGQVKSGIDDYIGSVIDLADQADLMPDNDEQLSRKDRYDVETCVDFLRKAIREQVCTPEIMALSRDISGSLFIKEKKKVKSKERRDVMTDALHAFTEQLHDIFRAGYAHLGAATRELMEGLDEVALQPHGTFCDPEDALVRLCRIYKAIREQYANVKPMRPEEASELLAHSQTQILWQFADYEKAEEEHRLVSKKAKAAYARFLRYLEKNERVIREDTDEILALIRSTHFALIYDSVRCALVARIKAYRALLPRVFAMRSSLEEAVTLALRHADSHKIGCMDLYAAEDYPHLYAKYQKTDGARIDTGALLGEQCYRYIAAADEEYSDGAGVVRAVQKQVADAVAKSAVFRETVDRSATEVFADKCRQTPKYAERVPAVLSQYARPVLAVTVPEDKEADACPTDRGYLILPEEAATAPDAWASFREFGYQTIFAKTDRREIMLVREKCHIKIEYIEQFSETLPGADCYAAFEQSLKLTQGYSTILWYPHIIGDTEYRESLPFISPQKQAEYQKSIIGAFLFSLIKGVFSVRYSAEEKKEILCFRGEDGSSLPVTVNGKAVSPGSFYLLFDWLRRRDGKVEEWNLAYRQLVDYQLNALPVVGLGGATEETLLRAIDTAPLIKTLRTNILNQVAFFGDPLKMGLWELAYRIKQAEPKTQGTHYAELVLGEGLALLRMFCGYRANDEAAEKLYLQETKVFAQQVRDSAGTLARNILAWVGKYEPTP